MSEQTIRASIFGAGIQKNIKLIADSIALVVLTANYIEYEVVVLFDIL